MLKAFVDMGSNGPGPIITSIQERPAQQPDHRQQKPRSAGQLGLLLQIHLAVTGGLSRPSRITSALHFISRLKLGFNVLDSWPKSYKYCARRGSQSPSYTSNIVNIVFEATAHNTSTIATDGLESEQCPVPATS